MVPSFMRQKWLSLENSSQTNCCISGWNHLISSKVACEQGEGKKLYGLEQLISTPTRVTKNSSSILDHMLTNSTDRVSQSGVIDTGLSDHPLIYCTRKITRTKFNSHKNITIRSLKNYSQDMYLEELNKINFPDYSKFTDINDAYSDFIGKVSLTIDKIAPMKEIRIKK